MFWTFLYLTRCSVRNRIRRRLRRLREPRYLVGLLVGVIYLYMVFFRRGARGPRGAAGVNLVGQIAGPMQFVGSVFLFLTAAGAWVLPGVGKPIAFTRPEVQFFFPAPVTRRDLLHYKLLRSQLGILFSSAIFTLLMRPSSLAGGWTFLAGMWLLLMAVRLHLMGVGLTRSSLAQHGRSALIRQWLPLAVVVGAVGALVATVVGGWAVVSGMPGLEAGFLELQRLSLTGPAGVVLWPFRALVRLPLAASPAEFWSHLPAAVVIVTLNYVWVLRADAAFEEASADHAEKQLQNRRAPRPVARGATAAPFQLAPDGPPETAILWKNLILVGRYVSLRTLLRLLPLVIVFGLVARGSGSQGVTAFVASVCLPLAAFAVLLGPQMMRNDLRQDLAHLEVLKTWPVKGAAIVRGEVLAPTVVVTAVTWLLILTAILLARDMSLSGRLAATVGEHRLSWALAAAALAPALVLSQIVVQNGLAVLFPAWVALGASRARGIDAMGQRLLMMAANLLALAISVVPGALVAGLAALAVYALTGTVLIVLPAMIVAVVIWGECWLATELLGRVLDRTDVNAIDMSE